MARVTDSLVIELRATFEKLAGDMNSAARSLSKFETQFGRIGANLGQALGLGFGAMVVGKLAHLAQLGDELGDLQQAYKNLGGSVGGINDATNATAGMISQVDLLRAANQGLIKGIPDFNANFSTIAQVATQVAEATGGTATEAINSLVNAIATGSPKALAKFGIFVEKGADVTEVYRQVNEQAKTYAPLGGDVASAQNQFNAALDNFTRTAGQAINNSGTLIGLFGYLSDALNKGALVWDYYFGVSDISKIVAQREKIEELKGQIDELNNSIKPLPLLGRIMGINADASQKLHEQLAKEEKALEKLKDSYKKGEGAETQAALQKREAAALAAKHAAELEKEKQKLEELDKSFDEWRVSELTNLINSGLKDSIERLDQADFQKYSQLLTQVTEVTVDGKLAPYIEAGLITPEAAAKWRDVMISQVTQPFITDFDKRMADSSSKARKEFVDAFSTVTGSVQNLLGMVEETFGVKIPQGLEKVLSVIQTITEAMKTINDLIEGVNKIIGFFEGGGSGGGSIIPGAPNIIPDDIPVVGGLFAKGGIVDSPTFFGSNGTLNIAGEAGPEAIMPLTRKGGRLGVAVSGGSNTGATLYIDARGAAPGVEFLIERAIERAAPGIVQGSVDAVMRSFQTGHSIRDQF